MRFLVLFFFFIISNAAFSQPQPTILVIGDSLSAGYGIEIEDSWPSLLQETLAQADYPHRVHNASISGQTSSEGLQQTDRLLQLTRPELVILELGANDGLRGLSIQQMKSNLQAIITKSLQANAKVLLVGIRVPSNYGRRFSEMFVNTFAQLANENNTAFVPFMLAPLEKVINNVNRAEYIQRDGLHPTAKAQPLILEHLWPDIQSAIQ